MPMQALYKGDAANASPLYSDIAFLKFLRFVWTPLPTLGEGVGG